MHELSFVEAMIREVEKSAAAHGIASVKAVHLRLGRLSGYVKETITSCFPMVAPGTLLANARLEIEDVPIKVRCQRCGAVSTKDDFHMACDACGQGETDLLEGRECLITGLEVD